MSVPPNGLIGGLVCLVAIFASSFLLVIGTLPFWNALRRVGAVRNALLVFWKTPPWLVVILTAIGGWILHTGLVV
jgi:chromate transporter